VTEHGNDVTLPEIYRLLQSYGRDLQIVRSEIKEARTEAVMAHERLRNDLTELHATSNETEWRVSQLERAAEIWKKEYADRAATAKEERRWLWTQVVGVAAGVAAVFAWVVDTYLRVRHQ
jgi:1,6-anhydro-N-acetylmuramate kinase